MVLSLSDDSGDYHCLLRIVLLLLCEMNNEHVYIHPCIKDKQQRGMCLCFINVYHDEETGCFPYHHMILEILSPAAMTLGKMSLVKPVQKLLPKHNNKLGIRNDA